MLYTARNECARQANHEKYVAFQAILASSISDCASLVAWTALAAGAVLASAVHATFCLLAALTCCALALAGSTAVLALRKRSRAATPGPKMSESPPPPHPAAEGSPSFIVLPAHARADEVTRVLFAEQSYFPVVQGREVIGVIFKGRLLRAIARGQGDRLIVELMNHTSSARPVLAS